MGLGHNDPWVESHMWPQQMWGQRSSRGQWPLWFMFFAKKGHCIHILWCIFMGLGHNDPWVESHIRPQQMWGQRPSSGQWLLVQVFAKTVTACLVVIYSGKFLQYKCTGLPGSPDKVTLYFTLMTYYINTLDIYIYIILLSESERACFGYFWRKKNDKLIYRENIYKAIAFLNSFTLKTSKFTRSLGGRLFHKTEAL